MHDPYECARAFAPYIPENVLILASGASCRDEEGHLHAYNASYMFYWLDRKGFNICLEEQSVGVIKSLVKRGARYFVAERWTLDSQPGFESDLRKEFKLIKECKEAVLFELNKD